jgi:hypothetical protein
LALKVPKDLRAREEKPALKALKERKGSKEYPGLKGQ